MVSEKQSIRFHFKEFFFLVLCNYSQKMKEDVKLKKVKKASKIKRFIVVEPGLVLILKKNQLLTKDELLHYQREFGEVSFIAKELKK